MCFTKYDGDPDYYASTPSRARQFIYDECDLTREQANEHVNVQLDEAQKVLAKAQKVAEPKMGTSIRKFHEA